MTHTSGQVRATPLTLRQAVYNAVRLAEAPPTTDEVLAVIASEWRQADETDVHGLLAWWAARGHMDCTADGRYVMRGGS